MKESTKQKIREAMLRIGHLPPSQKGIKRSAETRKKISEAKMGHIHSVETRKKMSLSRSGTGNHFAGKKHSAKSRKKMRASRKKLFANGFVVPNKKYFDPEEATRNRRWGKQKNGRLKRIQKKNGKTHTFGEWESLKKDYNHTCPCCKKEEPEIKLTIDHIIPLSKYGSDEISNIQPLCLLCNLKKHTKVVRY